MNPEQPLEGEVLVEIEKIREINPYLHEEVGGGEFDCVRAKDDEFGKWALSAYPNTLVAFKNIKVLPNGYLAVYRVSGVQTYEVDVFDPEGRFVYIMASPKKISLEDVKFYEFGFATKETQEDEFVFYTEYKIKNLPDIFKNQQQGPASTD